MLLTIPVPLAFLYSIQYEHYDRIPAGEERVEGDKVEAVGTNTGEKESPLLLKGMIPECQAGKKKEEGGIPSPLLHTEWFYR